MGGGGGGRGGGGGGAGAAPTRGTAAAGAAATPRPGAAGAAAELAFTLHNLRLVLFTDQGVMVADPVTVGLMPNDERGWVPVSVPLSSFRGAEDANNVHAVGVFADESDVFYLGRVSLIVDHTAVRATVTAEPGITQVNQLIEFSASLRGGTIDPKISWDFDDDDGLQEEAFGPKVRYVYHEPGDYLVTCTVTDRSGARLPIVESTGVHIEDAE